MYAISLTKNAAKSYNKLPEKSKNRVEAALNELQYSFTPNKLDVKKLKGSKNVYRARLGKWRIIYRVDTKEKSILVHDILPRKNAYG